tara:strand:+ start:243 stop:485 length:243 start_codon:yes stop_codon:yes gene_type:complete
MSIKAYGETEDEMDIKDRAKCRDIVQEILNFGVSQKQIVQLVYLLSLELENIDDMKHLSRACKAVADGEVNKGSTLIVNN